MANIKRTWAMPRQQRGHSLPELMVGLCVGLLVSSGALGLATQQMKALRRPLLEAQLAQDIGAVTDVMRRELRRAGTWETPERAMPVDNQAGVQHNPYAGIQVSADGRSISYSYARHDDRSSPTPNAPEDHQVTANERFGFRLQAGRIDMRMGANFQPLTDPGSVQVTSLQFLPSQHQLPGHTACAPNGQQQSLRILIAARAVQDPALRLERDFIVALRNDSATGACP